MRGKMRGKRNHAIKNNIKIKTFVIHKDTENSRKNFIIHRIYICVRFRKKCRFAFT